MGRAVGVFAALVLFSSCAGGAEEGQLGSSVASPDLTTVASATVELTPIDVAEADGPVAAGPVGEPLVDMSAGPVRSITIGGVGAEYARPVRSIMNLGVSVRRPSVGEASEAASAIAAAMVTAVEAAGVPPSGIQTSELGIDPVYDQIDYQRITGYQVRLGYNVTFADIDAIGSVLGAAIAAGGDDVRAWGVRFEPDSSALMSAARATAWEDVRARAEETAELASEPLGEVLDVHEKVLITSPQGMVQGGEGDSASFDIPVSPGAAGVTVLLTVTYAIGE